MKKNWEQMIIHHLPWYDKGNKTFRHIAEVIDRNFRYHYKNIEMIGENLDITTAKEMLSIYERHLGLKSEGSLESRRRKVLGTLMYIHQQTTETVVKNLIKSYIEGDSVVEIERGDVIDTLEIEVNQEGIMTENYEEIHEMLKKVLPAHLYYLMTFRISFFDQIYVGGIERNIQKWTIHPNILKPKQERLDIKAGMVIVNWTERIKSTGNVIADELERMI